MTLIIRNANRDFAEAVRSMAKACNSMIEITEQKEPSDELLETIRRSRTI